jgi:hypothetical protein
MEELVGRSILGVKLSPRRERLAFLTDVGTFVYLAEGDCCSDSWFHDVESLAHVVGQVVTGTEARDIGESNGDDTVEHDGGDCLQDYGITLTSAAGHHDIVYRNASNGYYGGWCALDWTDVPGLAFGSRPDTRHWTAIGAEP